MSLLSQTPVGREQRCHQQLQGSANAACWTTCPCPYLFTALSWPWHDILCIQSAAYQKYIDTQHSITPLPTVAVSYLYGEHVGQTKPLTMHPAKPSAPCSAVKDHCFAHMRIACKPWPPFLMSISVVTVSVRRPPAGHHASSSLSSVSFGCFPPAHTTRHASYALLEDAAMPTALCLWRSIW